MTSLLMECNHVHSDVLYELKVGSQLTVEEQEMTRSLLHYGTPSQRIKDFALDRLGKHLKTKAINYLQKKWSPKYMGKSCVKCVILFVDDIESTLHWFRCRGRVLTEKVGDTYSIIAFARKDQIELFRTFPEVVCVDGTHGTNREK